MPFQAIKRCLMRLSMLGFRLQTLISSFAPSALKSGLGIGYKLTNYKYL